MPFSEDDIPDMSDKAVLVTGATGGLGFETARMLASAGADVMLTGRNALKGKRAVERIRRIAPKSRVRFEPLDLADLQSVRTLSGRIAGEPIDILVNNAGLMAPPERNLTVDGFEVQFGVNHLGHFALAGLLLPALKAAGARVVAISSGIAAFGRIDFDNLQSQQGYAANTAYMQSKLANLLFMQGLQGRSERAGWNITSVAAHPGHARTDLIVNGAGQPTGLKRLMIWVLQAIASQDAAAGALPGVMAATAPQVQKRDYFGPTGLLHQKGPPGIVKLPDRAKDMAVADRLWAVSEELTGVRWGN